MKTIYQTKDGKIFDSSAEAQVHENNLKTFEVTIEATAYYRLNIMAEDLYEVEQELIEDNGELLDKYNATLDEYVIESACTECEGSEEIVDLKIR